MKKLYWQFDKFHEECVLYIRYIPKCRSIKDFSAQIKKNVYRPDVISSCCVIRIRDKKSKPLVTFATFAPSNCMKEFKIINHPISENLLNCK